MKSVLFWSTHFSPYKGGLENFLLELTTRLVKKGYSVTVVCLNSEDVKNHEFIGGVEVWRLPCNDLLNGVYALPKFNEEYKMLMKYVEREHYDYVLTNTRFFFTSFMGMIFAKKYKIKYYHIEHGNSFVQHQNKIVQCGAWWYDQTLGRMIMTNADGVIGISQKCCDFAKRLGAKHTGLIHNCIDYSKFKSVNTGLRRRLGIKKKDVVVTYVGRLIKAKGVHLLIQATGQSIKCGGVGGTGWKVLIVGKGAYEKELKEMAHEDVIFMGELDQKGIVEVLSITDVFVNPSFSEGLPTSVLEAHAMNIPVVATDVGGTSEIISQYLIKPNDDKAITDAIYKILYPKSFDWKDKIKDWEMLFK